MFSESPLPRCGHINYRRSRTCCLGYSLLFKNDIVCVTSTAIGCKTFLSFFEQKAMYVSIAPTHVLVGTRHELICVWQDMRHPMNQPFDWRHQHVCGRQCLLRGYDPAKLCRAYNLSVLQRRALLTPIVRPNIDVTCERRPYTSAVAAAATAAAEEGGRRHSPWHVLGSPLQSAAVFDVKARCSQVEAAHNSPQGGCALTSVYLAMTFVCIWLCACVACIACSLRINVA